MGRVGAWASQVEGGNSRAGGKERSDCCGSYKSCTPSDQNVGVFEVKAEVHDSVRVRVNINTTVLESGMGNGRCDLKFLIGQ